MNIITTNVEHQLLFIFTTTIIPALGILILIGLIYPTLKNKSKYKKCELQIVNNNSKTIQLTNSLNTIKSLYESKKYREGILLIYKNVKDYIINELKLNIDKSLTEREILIQILNQAHKLTFNINLFTKLYEIYELTRFSNKEVFEQDFNTCINILNSICKDSFMQENGVK
ncbi:MAG: hypothetical protein QW372_06295 [Nitrososphaerales archaeon]